MIDYVTIEIGSGGSTVMVEPELRKGLMGGPGWASRHAAKYPGSAVAAAPVVDEEALRQAFMSGCGTGAEADPAWHEDTVAEYRAAGWEAYRAALEAALTQPNGGQDR